jgi:DNA-binding NarL/FixJ family response regulator
MQLRILMADDHDVVRTGIRTVLERQANVEVVGEASDGRSAARLADELSPDLVLMDIGMPDLNGVEATRQIAGEDRRVKVIALSMHLERRVVTDVLRAGASGYVLKDAVVTELSRAIGAVMAGRVYLSPRVADLLVEDYVRRLPNEPEGQLDRLTSKEREVLQLLAEGKSTKEIAADLFLSPKTVESHRGSIMAKLDLHSVAELTKYAVREGLTSL